MSIRLYNSASHVLEEFVPQQDEIRMYVCGPTVYDEPHIGNLRPAVIFDVLFRLLQNAYPDRHIDYARNFTDIDDKIIARAAEEGITIETLTERTIAQYGAAMQRINVQKPTYEPRATRSLVTMIDIIESLVDRGIAYVSEGNVLFHVPLSQHVTDIVPKHDEEDAAPDTEVASYKRDRRDFVLWKPSKPGEPSYQGPLGLPGRPGWHIECSAMIHDIFRRSNAMIENEYILDIHGGGNDLKFPHHQCEIMQSETCHGYVDDYTGQSHQIMARHWLHNGMLTVNGQKMSKSADNFIRESDTRLWAHGEALRYLLLTGHYRQPLDFTREKLNEAQTNMDRLYGALEAVWDAEDTGEALAPNPVQIALENDLNTPEAIAALHGLSDAAYKATTNAYEIKTALLHAGKLLGLFSMTPEEWFRGMLVPEHRPIVERWIGKRNEARANKNFGLADHIRSDLLDMFWVEIEDGQKGTKWRRVRNWLANMYEHSE